MIKARRPFSWQDLLLERVNLAIPYSYTLDQYQSRVSCLYHNLQYILMDRARTSLELTGFCVFIIFCSLLDSLEWKKNKNHEFCKVTL